MTDRPILFSAPMVRALLAGAKTQTRRIVKPQPSFQEVGFVGMLLGFKKRKGNGFWLWPNARERIIAECPYGQPGDRLWVRETWAPRDNSTMMNKHRHEVFYRADDETHHWSDGRWRPSIHMPRWASRITLEVTEVRVERLQGISETDALAEGITFEGGMFFNGDEREYDTGRDAYAGLWESINGPGSWDENPWVWVVAFKRVEGGRG